MDGNRATENGSLYRQTVGINKNQFTLMTMLVWLTIISLSLIPTGIWQFDGVLPLVSQHNGGSQVAMADGSCRFVSQEVSSDMIQAALTINGSENVNLDQ